MTRVNYKKENGLLISKPFLAGQGLVVVTIDPTTMTYKINHFETNAVLVSGRENTLHQLKIEAKFALGNLGVQFDEEARHHRPKAEVKPVDEETTLVVTDDFAEASNG